MAYTVLFIAPEDSFRQQLSVLLAAQGLLVTEEADPEEAVRVLTDHGADVVLYATGESHEDDLRRIQRMHDAAPKAGIILLENGGSIDFVMEARKRGVWDDILIPFELTELLEKIRAAGKRARPEDKQE
ncbi:response regulator [Desulfovibrio ferrophilus]|uniref:Response regulator receiver protein n=1 Tax=Desulfovibrio ferrophilus TaxID=241368 RepID=A0A2Z6AXP5_9BACT|nr:response regulator [Desulfovibrio ferrophilus]BBD08011.1 response regulator receiver protein [Desulfovibrio ferrophilus]